MKKITLYICSKCGEEYRSKIHCERHEATCKAQNCEMCKHGIHVVNGVFRCELYFLGGKDCKFELKEKTK